MANNRSKIKLDGMIISDTSIRQPVFITMLMLLTVVIGLISYFRLPVELFPNIALPTISVTVPYPGAGPQSVADQVARPVENALNTISGVNTISSISSSNVAQIVAEFDTGVDLNRAEQSVREQVNAVLPTLPPNIQDPIFQRLSSDLFPVLVLVVSDEQGRSPLELRTLLGRLCHDYSVLMA
jgi:HAE1 family hydrophobic/amphiphilic exporter-1